MYIPPWAGHKSRRTPRSTRSEARSLGATQKQANYLSRSRICYIKHTHKKAITISAILIILVLALAGVLAYISFNKKPSSNEKTLSNNSNDTQSPVTSSQALPTTCTDQPEGMPVITSLSSYSGYVGTKIEIKGCNFAGFEGDKNAWIENGQGVKGILNGEEGSTGKNLKVTIKSPLCQEDNSYSGLPCKSYLTLTPGTYKIYTMPWLKKSNEVTFTIK